jgi:hypothetical protein
VLSVRLLFNYRKFTFLQIFTRPCITSLEDKIFRTAKLTYFSIHHKNKYSDTFLGNEVVRYLIVRTTAMVDHSSYANELIEANFLLSEQVDVLLVYSVLLFCWY